MKVGDLYISQGTARVQKGHTIVITKLSRHGRMVNAIIVNTNRDGCFTRGYVEQNYTRKQ